MTTIDLASCLAAIPDRRLAEGKIYSQVGAILFSIIAMLTALGHIGDHEEVWGGHAASA